MPKYHNSFIHSLSRLLQLHFCRLEGFGLMETHHRPFPLEQGCSSDKVHDRDEPVGSMCSSEGRLDGPHRPKGCLLSGPSPSREPEVSSVRRLQEGLPVQDPLFWSLHGPSSIYQGHGSSFGYAPRPQRPDSEVPGQLVNSGLFQNRGFVGKGHCVGSLSPTWHLYQL